MSYERSFSNSLILAGNSSIAFFIFTTFLAILLKSSREVSNWPAMCRNLSLSLSRCWNLFLLQDYIKCKSPLFGIVYIGTVSCLGRTDFPAVGCCGWGGFAKNFVIIKDDIL